MRKVLWMIVILTDSFFSYGQRTEYALQAGSGFFSYRGPNAVDATGVYLMEFSLLNPYGQTSAFSYSLAGQVQHVTKSKILFGLQAGYEQLTSQVAITYISGDPGGPTPVTGQATLQNQYLNFYPFFGKRFGNERFSLDATLGLDAAIGLRSREFIRVDKSYQTFWGGGERSRGLADDFRPRANVTAYYRSFGLSVGYSHGLTNYLANRYSDRRVYSQFWRLGLSYRLKS